MPRHLRRRPVDRRRPVIRWTPWEIIIITLYVAVSVMFVTLVCGDPNWRLVP